MVVICFLLLCRHLYIFGMEIFCWIKKNTFSHSVVGLFTYLMDFFKWDDPIYQFYVFIFFCILLKKYLPNSRSSRYSLMFLKKLYHFIFHNWIYNSSFLYVICFRIKIYFLPLYGLKDPSPFIGKVVLSSVVLQCNLCHKSMAKY